MKAKKLIEVALPIKEISAESKRDKSLRHGHISTLQYWLARRPLPVCRAVVFASLVPDPLDENCPEAFKWAVEMLLCTGHNGIKYKPYRDIPYTSIFDPMEENFRNRLLMFIGQFSDTCQKNMISGKDTPSKDQLSDYSLIKWENKNNEDILRIARELIFVSYQSEKRPSATWEELHAEFNKLFDAISVAEEKLYSIQDRHIETELVKQAETSLRTAIVSFQNEMPSVFDPFAGGGAIPLEAARLGCRSYGNDINPVAHIIERSTVEFPQKYGKRIIISKDIFVKNYGDEGISLYEKLYKDRPVKEFYISNRLMFDVQYYSNLMLSKAQEKVKNLYPEDNDGSKPCGYYWIRYGKCANPSCQNHVPLFRSFILSSKKGNQHSFFPEIIDGKLVLNVRKGQNKEKGWFDNGLICPFCGSVTSLDNLKEQSKRDELRPQLVALIYDTPKGKIFKGVDEKNTNVVNNLKEYPNKPTEKMHPNSGGGDTFGWGIDHYSQLFLDRQLYTINAIIESLHEIKGILPHNEYGKAIIFYLALLVNRVTPRSNMFVLLNTAGENLEHIYRRQAIPMVYDFPESAIFCDAMGGAYNQIEWITKFIESESSNPFSAQCFKTASGDVNQFPEKSLDAVITDPPYYDAMAYADFSDFYYLWFRKILMEEIPEILSTPQTPKSEECTAIKHYHGDSIEKAKVHFENMLTSIFSSIEYQTKGIVSIMFAHQSTEAWTTLCNSILTAGMNINGSWAIDSERSNAGIKTGKSFLESSVTVSCRPSERKGYADYEEVKHDIRQLVKYEVEKLYGLGFRGADLLTACFGQAVSVFGHYKRVETSEGDPVSVQKLLEFARESAAQALLEGVPGEPQTKFYCGWLQMNGMKECDFDDVNKYTRVGVNVEIRSLQSDKLLISDGNKQHLATAKEHVGGSTILGTQPSDFLISQAHRMMLAYLEGNDVLLLRLVRDLCPQSDAPLWRVIDFLQGHLPDGSDDLKAAKGLLAGAEMYRQKCKETLVHQEGVLQFED